MSTTAIVDTSVYRRDRRPRRCADRRVPSRLCPSCRRRRTACPPSSAAATRHPSASSCASSGTRWLVTSRGFRESEGFEGVPGRGPPLHRCHRGDDVTTSRPTSPCGGADTATARCRRVTSPATSSRRCQGLLDDGRPALCYIRRDAHPRDGSHGLHRRSSLPRARGARPPAGGAGARSRKAAATLPARGVETLAGDSSLFERPDLQLPACDSVIHLAGVVTATTPEQYDAVNLQAVKTLVKALGRQAWRPQRLLFASSLAAAGPSATRVAKTERDPAEPIDAYGRAKLAAERFLAALPAPRSRRRRSDRRSCSGRATPRPSASSGWPGAESASASPVSRRL